MEKSRYFCHNSRWKLRSLVPAQACGSGETGPRAIFREACFGRGVEAADMQVLLRGRYFDPRPLQRLSNRRHHLALQLNPRILVRGPKAKLKIQRAIAKTEKVSFGR